MPMATSSTAERVVAVLAGQNAWCPPQLQASLRGTAGQNCIVIRREHRQTAGPGAAGILGGAHKLLLLQRKDAQIIAVVKQHVLAVRTDTRSAFAAFLKR